MKKNRLASLIALSLFAFLFSSIAITSFLQKSPTYDETIHLFAGYSYLEWADFRTNPEHPPLAKILAAMPLLALDLKDPIPGSPYWDLTLKNFSYGWLLAHQMLFLENDAETLFFYAKLPMIALGILLGIFIYHWAKELYGIHAGAMALFLYGLDPNFLAHTSLAHTDVPFAAFFFIANYFYWRALGRLTWFNLFWTSCFFGLSAITKYSFLTILPIWVILGLVKIFAAGQLGTGSFGGSSVSSVRGKIAVRGIGVLVVALIVAYFLTWAAYGFRFNAVANGEGHGLELAQVWPENIFLRAFAAFSNQYHVFPEAWTYGLLYVFRSLGRPAYLLGQVSDDGFWLYFPAAFLVKTTLPTLILSVAVALLFLKRRPREAELFLLIPVIAYFSFAVLSGLNIGLRHLLPVYPFVFVLVGGAASRLWAKGVTQRSALILLLVWQAWSSWKVYPHYLAYFNELIGGPRNGYRVLTDSSLDWGQDLKGLKRWMDQNGVKKIQLGYFGTADPKYYGIDAIYLPGSILFSAPSDAKPQESSEPEYLAVSATYVYGVHSGEPLRHFYKPLRKKEPVATIGYSIFVYRLD